MILERSRNIITIYWSWKNVIHLIWNTLRKHGIKEKTLLLGVRKTGLFPELPATGIWDQSFPTVPLRFFTCEREEL